MQNLSTFGASFQSSMHKPIHTLSTQASCCYFLPPTTVPATQASIYHMSSECKTISAYAQSSIGWTLPRRSGHLQVVPVIPIRTLTAVTQMGKLAQRFNLSQRKRKQEQAAISDRSGKESFQASQANPVQLPGSQVLRRVGSSDAPLGPASTGGSVDGHRHRHVSAFHASSELPPKISSASKVSKPPSYWSKYATVS